MYIFANGEEVRLLEVLESIKNNNRGYYGLHFYFSKLEEKNKNNFQLRVTLNIIKDFFKGKQGCIVHFKDNDIIVIFESEERALVEKIIFQLRYLFIDDPLAFEAEGVENYKFCNVYMLSFQWRDFYIVCSKKVQLLSNNFQSPVIKEVITPSSLNNLIKKMDSSELALMVKSQGVYGYNNLNNDYTSIYKEVYISISALKAQLKIEEDLLGEKYLFRYFTQVLDLKLLDFLSFNSRELLSQSFSINLNVTSIFSNSFAKLVEILRSYRKNNSIIIELQISDIFEDFQLYVAARDILKSLNFKISIDGLSDSGFLQINRENIGADLVKIRWSPESLSIANGIYIAELESMVKKSGVNRVVLCRCDDTKAIEFGKAMGIKLFQGWHIDKITKKDNDQDLVNSANISTWELYKN
jgi:hypothetical protein